MDIIAAGLILKGRGSRIQLFRYRWDRIKLLALVIKHWADAHGLECWYGGVDGGRVRAVAGGQILGVVLERNGEPMFLAKCANTLELIL